MLVVGGDCVRGVVAVRTQHTEHVSDGSTESYCSFALSLPLALYSLTLVQNLRKPFKHLRT